MATLRGPIATFRAGAACTVPTHVALWNAAHEGKAADSCVRTPTRTTTVKLEHLALGRFRATGQAETQGDIPRSQTPDIPHCPIRHLPVREAVISQSVVVPFPREMSKITREAAYLGPDVAV